jgi:hypothetical protein
MFLQHTHTPPQKYNTLSAEARPISSHTSQSLIKMSRKSNRIFSWHLLMKLQIQLKTKAKFHL